MTEKFLDEYYIYLRKSRADQEAELRGEGETLAKHEKALFELAKRQGLHITKIFREIVSGETIAARPEVQKLLQEVEEGIPAGVLVMEIERLARGDTKDQGIVAEAFKYGDVKIITPMKTYDPNNEFDEEYFEFGLFMSRREYKTIRRRLWNGRLASVKAGKWIASCAPYGYKRIKLQNDTGYSLEIVPEEAEVVRYVFELFTTPQKMHDGSFVNLGYPRIAKKLDSMNIKPRQSKYWNMAVIRDMLTNPTYAGKVRWGYRPYMKVIENGVAVKVRNKNAECMIYDGLHPAIIAENLFEKTQNIIKEHNAPPVPSKKFLTNPLAGLVKCGFCGSTMTKAGTLKKDGYFSMRCPNVHCNNVSSPLYLIENKILDGMKGWIVDYDLDYPEIDHYESDSSILLQSLKKSEEEIKTLNKQLENAYDMVEQGVYSTDIFIKRSQLLTDRINVVSTNLEALKNDYEIMLDSENSRNNFLPQVRKILELYGTYESPKLKNDLLKTVLEKVEYKKETANKKGMRDNATFTLKFYPKIPKV